MRYDSKERASAVITGLQNSHLSRELECELDTAFERGTYAENARVLALLDVYAPKEPWVALLREKMELEP